MLVTASRVRLRCACLAVLVFSAVPMLVPGSAIAQRQTVPKAFLDTAQPYVERMEECRVLGEKLMSSCFQGVYDSEIRHFQKCLGTDIIPRTLTVEQYGCLWAEISADIF